MKNTVLKYYLVASYLCSTFITFAADTPGDDTAEGNLNSEDSLPIDNYIWVLALIGLFFVFMKFREIQKKSMQQ